MTETLPVLNVPVEEVTPAALDGFGDILGRTDVPVTISDFMETVELRKPVRFVSDDKTMLSLATVHRRPLEVRWLERHYKHTQTFIPLGGRPFVIALAKPTRTEFPDPADVRAFALTAPRASRCTSERGTSSPSPWPTRLTWL